MVDHYGVLIDHTPCKHTALFDCVDVSQLYAQETSWDKFEEIVSHLAYDDPGCGYGFDEDDLARLDLDGIQVQLALLDFRSFATGLLECTHLSHASMALESISINNSPCKIFEEMTSAIASAFASLAVVTAGRSGGVTAVFCIPHDNAAWTLSMISQLFKQNADSSLSRNVSTNDCAIRYRHIKSAFFTDTLFATKNAKSTCDNICAKIFVSDKGFVALYPMKDQQSYFLALKQFAKDVVAPEVLVCHSQPTQKKQDVKEFCTQIGTTLRAL